MKDSKNKSIKANNNNAIYGLGLIGAAVFYVQQVDEVVDTVVALLKAIVWPAFVVYDLLKFLAG